MGKIPKVNETLCIKLFSQLLNEKPIKGKGVFDFLRGDKGTRLPVDAFFPKHNLAVEYMGEQHYLDNKMMNQKPGRKEQRKKYDLLRETLIPQHGFKLIQIKYDEPLTLEHIKRKIQEASISKAN